MSNKSFPCSNFSNHSRRRDSSCGLQNEPEKYYWYWYVRMKIPEEGATGYWDPQLQFRNKISGKEWLSPEEFESDPDISPETSAERVRIEAVWNGCVISQAAANGEIWNGGKDIFCKGAQGDERMAMVHKLGHWNIETWNTGLERGTKRRKVEGAESAYFST